MRTHIVLCHPEILDSFEGGWQALSNDAQSHWSQKGNALSQPLYEYSWLAWPEAQLRWLQHENANDLDDEVSDFHVRIHGLIQDQIAHVGELYNMPDMPCLVPKSWWKQDGKTVFKDGEIYAGTTNDIIDRIACAAAERILGVEMAKVCKQLVEEIQRDGINAVRKWYPPRKIA